MQDCNFKLLGYAKSELDVEGIPFAIVFHLKNEPYKGVRGLLSSDFFELLGQLANGDKQYLEGFLEDWEYYAVTKQANASFFFESLEGLSSGPLRNICSGVCSARDLPMELFTTEEQPIKRVSGAIFIAISKQLHHSV